MPAIAAGNTVVAIPSEAYPLIAGDLYQVFETSDLAGRRREYGDRARGGTDESARRARRTWMPSGALPMKPARATAKALSMGNLKQVWTNEGRAIDWFDVDQGEGRWFLRHAMQVKNIWVPYGE